tara:strand:- start:161 stop:1645 length:1485 start_codon:yes stop_codon:yes gene_type:complete
MQLGYRPYMGSKSSKSELINDRVLQSWIRCRRKAWLEQYGDKNLRTWPTHKTLQLDHQKKSFLALAKNHSGIGIKACIEGKRYVFGIRVKKEILGHEIKSNLALIQKYEGISKFGDFTYRPVITRQGNNITREHKLLLTMKGLLLEKFQGTKVPLGILIYLNQGKFEINKISLHDGLYKELFNSIKRIKYDLSQSKPPPLTSNRKKCSICNWKELCNNEANIEGDLSEINGIGTKRKQILEKLGINSIKDLAKTNPASLKSKLKEFGSQHSEIAPQIVTQALAQVSGNKKRINKNKALTELNKSPGILIYDIESDPDVSHDFLHGFISIQRDSEGNLNIEKSKYHPILNIEKNNEKLLWRRIKRKLKKYPDWPILHYGETELLAILKIAKEQGQDDNEIKVFQDRFIDIHERLKKHWILPTSSYSLKSIAKWLGFQWTKEDADGSKALLWWRQWQSSKKSRISKSKNLRSILTYNKDDCLATWEIAKWMIEEDI